MADQPDFTADASPTLQQLVDYLADSLTDPERLKRLQTTVHNAALSSSTTAKAVAYKVLDALFERFGQFLFAIEEHVEPIVGPPLARLAGHLIGVDIPVAELRKSAKDGEGGVVGAAMANLALSAFSAESGDLQPGQDGAKRFIALVSQLVFNGWFEATAFEMLTTLFPDMDAFESVAELPHELVDALGLGRLGRVALRPLAQTLVATPLSWDLNKRYRPSMLADAAVVRAFFRGDYSADEAREELQRAGYSDKRIDMLVADALKWPSLGDLMIAVRDGQVDRDYVKSVLRKQGYDDVGADTQLAATQGAMLAAIHDDSYTAVQAAYVDRRIDDAAFEQYTSVIFPDQEFRNAHEVAARTIRDVNTKPLSASQAADCVKAKILPIASYRDALTREGYDADAVLALELLLEKQIDDSLDVDKARRQKAADADAAAKAKAAADAAKKAAAEQAAALKRRGSPAELTRAAVRGLIPIDRALEVLGADLDSDTVAIYRADIEAQRADYVAQQQKAADAAKRADNRGLSIGQLESAVLDDVLTLDQFADQLRRAGLTADDQAILVATLKARKADADAATQKRLDADRRAAASKINLTTFEQLVRAGIRPMADYDSLLAALGFSDADRASLVALLQQKIDADVAAKQLRDAQAAKDATKGLSLDQFRRAVILRLKTLDEFSTYLTQQGYTVDASAVLVAELADDVTQADAARAKRDAAGSSGGAAGLPLSTVTRAARLGILTPAQYQADLVARGYAPDDVALELALLSQEIADVKQAKRQQAAADATKTDTDLTLAQIAAAVKAGEASLAFYRSRALTLGLSDADADTLTRVLGDELANTNAAKARRAVLESTVKAGDVSLSVLESQVRDGSLTIDDFAARLTDAGLDPVDVDLLVALLRDELGG